MERVRSFVQKRISKAYGLLQVLKGKLLPDFRADVESGPLDPSPPLKIDRSFRDTPELDSVDVPGTFVGPNDHPIEREEAPQTQFTKGPARFIEAHDGSETCTALLVTDTLMTKLDDLFEESLQLEIKSRPLEHARIDAREAQISVDEATESLKKVQESLEKAESQKRVEELQKVVRQQERGLIKACQRRDRLEEEYGRVERSITLSRNHALWVLNTAMKEANLLRPRTVVSPVSTGDDESHGGSEISAQQGSMTSASEDYTEPPLSESEQLRQAVRAEMDKRSCTLDIVQAKFDNQRRLYEENLAEYQQGFGDGTFQFSRTEFDCRKLEYGQKLTRALINAEEAYDRAEERAKAVGAIGPRDSQSPGDGQYDESLPDNHMASYIATKDWGFIHDWLANVPDADMLQNPNSQKNPEYTEDGVWDEERDGLDWTRGNEDGDWDIAEAEIHDSASAVDYDLNRRNLDRWQQLCAQPLPEDSPQAWDTWPEAIHMWPVKEVERRHSFGGYSCQSWDDWESKNEHI
ncbi:MAG: hypothetical protein ALECFALPRED_009879 [Alectoria fallacina]|uniref:Uncharacterized protein n=1 Tax=Alectoria fallacina TaxID=1903189 RepID=A0A8H3J8N8_9LECA|nr:MAG: hypothetical protein ALECFALPRED_009879 [Alectoria fallacina]